MSDEERVRLFEVAYDSGITHFDTARSYGMGAAERTLGRFIAGKRDLVTITTKLGILPPKPKRWMDLARAVMRGVERVAPSLGARAKQGAARRMIATGRFSLEDARSSLETSLRELRTDHVDVLLLHECLPGDLQDDLLDFLHQCVDGGKVRLTGTATGIQDTTAILARGLDFPSVLQVPNSVVEPGLERVDSVGRVLITHSALSCLGAIGAAFAGSPLLAARWSEAVGIDCSDPRSLAALCLRYAVAANGEGVVLFSSSRPDHIRETAAALGDSSMSEEQVAAFAACVRRDLL